MEDAAHAHGASYDGQPAGSFGVAAGFSFFPTKVVTCGEGGMILTHSAELDQQARIYRDQGKGSVTANHHVLHGYAWRMSEQAAVTGLVHLRRMAEFIEHRRLVAARYDAALAGLDRLGSPWRAARLPDQFLQVHRRPPGRRGPGQVPPEARRGPCRCGWRVRSMTFRCIASRCLRSSPDRRCRYRRNYAPDMYACRFTPT